MRLAQIHEGRSGKLATKVRGDTRTIMKNLAPIIKEILASPEQNELTIASTTKPTIDIKDLMKIANTESSLSFFAGLAISAGTVAASVAGLPDYLNNPVGWAATFGGSGFPTWKMIYRAIKYLWDHKKRVMHIQVPHDLGFQYEIYFMRAAALSKPGKVASSLWKSNRAGEYDPTKNIIQQWVTITANPSFDDVYFRIQSTLIHELVHRYQQLYQTKPFADLKMPEDDHDAYIKHPAEIEAEYYATIKRMHNYDGWGASFVDHTRSDRNQALKKFAEMAKVRHPGMIFGYDERERALTPSQWYQRFYQNTDDDDEIILGAADFD